jgi:DnaJ like chaperone protein
MSIFGKLIGGAAGFMLGGPIGLLIGVAAGHLVDHAARRAFEQRPPAAVQTGEHAEWPERRRRNETIESRQAAFAVALIVLAAKMAKADGRVSHEEIRAFKRIVHIPPDEEAQVGRIFDAARQDALGFEPYARQIAEMFRGAPGVLEQLLLGLAAIAVADGALHEAERRYLNDIARLFGLGPAIVERVLSTLLPETGPDPYKVLGVKPNAPEAEIKAAYRALMREHHPDRLTAQGMPQEMIELATKESQAINAAFDQVARARGFK